MRARIVRVGGSGETRVSQVAALGVFLEDKENLLCCWLKRKRVEGVSCGGSARLFDLLKLRCMDAVRKDPGIADDVELEEMLFCLAKKDILSSSHWRRCCQPRSSGISLIEVMLILGAAGEERRTRQTEDYVSHIHEHTTMQHCEARPLP